MMHRSKDMMMVGKLMISSWLGDQEDSPSAEMILIYMQFNTELVSLYICTHLNLIVDNYD